MVRQPAPPPLSRYPLDRLGEASVHRQELCPKGPGRFATTPPTAPPNPFPLGRGFGCLEVGGAGAPNPGSNASQTRWSNTELQRAPYAGRFRRRGR